ncbi:MAG: ABC transporter substrate-binding protein [Planctomycetaceae bacterium]
MTSGYWRFAICLWAMLAWACASPTAYAQSMNFGLEGEPEDEGIALLQAHPHDIVRFTEKAGGGWVKVHPLELPGRKLPTSPTGELPMEVLGLEGQKFSAKWGDIQSIDLWEERLERETTERMKAGDFSGAYPYLAILIRDYPARPNLRQLRSEFLLNNAAKRFTAGELEPTLAILEELRRYNPPFQPDLVLRVISRVTDRLMKSMADANRLDDAQKLLARLQRDYPGNIVESVKIWDEKFLAMAQEKREAAIAARDKEDWRTARQLANESLYLYPGIPGGKELVKEIDVAYPLVRVGVMQTASELDPTRIDNWASRRAGRLVYRTLFEMRGTGPEGGEYDFILGEAEQTPDRLRYDLTLRPEKMRPPLDRITSQTLADLIAKRSQVDSGVYNAPWAAAIDAITLGGPQEVSCLLRSPNVLPSSLLQIRIDGEMIGLGPGEATGVYQRSAEEAGEVRFKLTGEPANATQPREVVELKMESAQVAVSKLLRGEIDIVDHLFPSDAGRLRKSRQITVENFPLPTVHMLVPCSDHAFLADRNFRRAVLYGINREDILQGELLENQQFPGCRVISGPFPAGIEENDPLAYAYDERIAPRPYQPQLATLLMVLARKQLEAVASKLKQKPPELTPIRLAMPDDALSQIACEAIKMQLEAIKLQVELVQLPPGKTWPEEGTADLVYVSAAVWEPTIDARRILGPDGLARSQDQLIGLGLRRLESANNWRDVRDRLNELHSIASHELPIIPLWQIVDSFAYRRDLTGIGRDIVSLYQNVERWRLSF